MTFNEFANMLMSVLSGGDNTAEFARKLADNITDIPHDVENNPIENLTDSAWKKYFTGTNSIRLTARKIIPYLDDEKFIAYLDVLSDAARNELCDKLKSIYPEVDYRNVAELCASLFKSILIESAEISKSKNTNKKINNTITRKTASKNINDEKLKEKYKLSLLIESGCRCQNHNCCENLYTLEDGKSNINFKITQIDPDLEKDSFENLIALCHKCSSKYSLVDNEEKVKAMKEIKNKLMTKCDAKDTLSASKVEIGIEKVVRKIRNKPTSELVELRYEPVSVDKKILKENSMLLMKNVIYVTTYYNYINDLFKQLEKEGLTKFKLFCMQIQYDYETLEKKGLSQSEIYEELVDWLMNITKENREPCEAVISYFVQNCEVFYAISK